MHNVTGDVSEERGYDINAASTASTDAATEAARTARRLRQLVDEIRNALVRHDTALAKHASALLTPAVDQWRALRPPDAPVLPDELLLAGELCLLLDACAAEAADRMSRAAGELRRLRRARATLARLRGHRDGPRYRLLNTRY